VSGKKSLGKFSPGNKFLLRSIFPEKVSRKKVSGKKCPGKYCPGNKFLLRSVFQEKGVRENIVQYINFF